MTAVFMLDNLLGKMSLRICGKCIDRNGLSACSCKTLMSNALPSSPNRHLYKQVMRNSILLFRIWILKRLKKSLFIGTSISNKFFDLCFSLPLMTTIILLQYRWKLFSSALYNYALVDDSIRKKLIILYLENLSH